jgi:hypothetical protein
VLGIFSHFTSRYRSPTWINWTNLLSLYESFLFLNMFRVLLHSSSGAGDCMWVCCSVSVCTGVLVRLGWSRVVSECRLEHSVTTLLQYTPKQSNTTTYSRHLLRMSVISLETCWAIKTFVEWHQVGSVYSTSKMMRGPINIRYRSLVYWFIVSIYIHFLALTWTDIGPNWRPKLPAA